MNFGEGRKPEGLGSPLRVGTRTRGGVGVSLGFGRWRLTGHMVKPNLARLVLAGRSTGERKMQLVGDLGGQLDRGDEARGYAN